MADKRNGFLKQFNICFKQCVASFKNDKGWKSFISVVIITILIVIVMSSDTFKTYVDTKNSAFALICACIWVGIFSSIRSICRERDIIKHEHRTGLIIASYISAHWIYEAILSLIDALIITIIVVLSSPGHFIDKGVFLLPAIELYITFFLVVFSADALGILISSIVPTENAAMTVMPFALIIQLVMSGAVFKLEGIANLISYATISRWGLAAICSTAHLNNMAEALIQPSLVVDEYYSTFSNLTTLWLLLLAFAVIYAILSIIILELTVDR